MSAKQTAQGQAPSQANHARAMAATFKHLFVIDPLFFSWSQSFLFLTATVLVIVVPTSLPIRAAATTPGLAAFFPHLFVILLAVYALNFGQTQGDPQRMWRLRYGSRFGLHALQLGVRLSLMMSLTLPLWLLFFQLFHLRGVALLALFYLWLQAQLWGWFGLWLSLKGFSEINQFKIKYLVLILFFTLTLLVPVLSPFFTLQILLDPNVPALGSPHVWLALLSTVLLMALLGVGLVRLSRRRAAASW